MPDYYVLTSDHDTQHSIAKALGYDEGLPASLLCKTLSILGYRMKREAAPVVVIDAASEREKVLKDVEALVTHFPQSRFVILCERPDPDFIVRAMQAGVRHVQPKESVTDGLREVFDRFHASSNASAVHTGHTVCVFQASGGCGGTTIAVNVTNELRLLSKETVLLADLDHCYGAAAVYLGLKGLYGIAEILNHPNDIDTHLVSTTTLRYAPDFHMLASPASVDLLHAVPPPLERMDLVLAAARKVYGWSVLDAPRLPLASMARLAIECDVVLIVFQQLVKDVKMVRAMVTELNSQGVAPERILPVLNRYDKRGRMVSFDEAQGAIRLPLHHIRNDFSSAAKSINFGKPLAEIAKNSPLRKDAVKLVQHIDGLVGTG